MVGKNRDFLKILAVTLGIFLIGILGYLYNSYRRSFPPSLPQSVIGSVNFKIYYPSRVPSGYLYKKGSATSHNGLLFSKFINGKKIITVTEQAAPAANIDFNKLEGGYTSIESSIGRAAVGISVGNPSIIIITDSTLISINSSKGVPKDQVIGFAKNMKLIVVPNML